MDEFIASDDKADFIENLLYEAGELEEFSYDFYFQYNGNEEIKFLLQLGRPDFLDEVDENEDDEDEKERKYIYYCNLMLTNMFDTLIYNNIIEKLLS